MSQIWAGRRNVCHFQNLKPLLAEWLLPLLCSGFDSVRVVIISYIPNNFESISLNERSKITISSAIEDSQLLRKFAPEMALQRAPKFSLSVGRLQFAGTLSCCNWMAAKLNFLEDP